MIYPIPELVKKFGLYLALLRKNLVAYDDQNHAYSISKCSANNR